MIRGPEPGGGSDSGCLRCGSCCRWPGHIWLSGGDVRRLAAGLGLTERETIARHTGLTRNRAGLTLLERPDGACVFLRDGSCSVYGSRPRQCREFPDGWAVRGGCPHRVPVARADPAR